MFVKLFELLMHIDQNNICKDKSFIYNILSISDFKTENLQKYILRLGEKYKGFIDYNNIVYRWSLERFIDFIYINYLNQEEDRVEQKKDN